MSDFNQNLAFDFKSIYIGISALLRYFYIVLDEIICPSAENRKKSK